MKRFGLMMMAAGVLAMSAPAFAADHGAKKSERDECLIASHACASQAKTLQEKLATLEKEIKKGTKVYSKEEIQKLSAKLKEAEDTLKVLLQR